MSARALSAAGSPAPSPPIKRPKTRATSHSGRRRSTSAMVSPARTLAGLEHPVVPAGKAVGDDLRDDAGIAQPVPLLPARLPPLADLDQRRAEPVTVADADRALGQPQGRDVLAESAGGLEQRMAAGQRPPEGIVIGWIMVDRLVGPAMDRKVRLRVAREAEPADLDRTFARRLGDGAGPARRKARVGLAGQDGEDFMRHDQPLQPLPRHAPSAATSQISATAAYAAKPSHGAEYAAPLPRQSRARKPCP